mgnify:CR=1 FL=1
MKKERKYIIIVAALFVVLILVQLFTPKPINWNITLSRYDKNPYGAFVLYELMPGIFPQQKLTYNNRTLYEIIEEEAYSEDNIIILCTELQMEEQDISSILDFVDQGGQLLLASHLYRPIISKLSDTLELESAGLFQPENPEDSTFIYFKNDTDQKFFYNLTQIPEYFISYDTANTEILALNEDKKPVLIKTSYGEGEFIFSTTPLVFSNYYMVHQDHNRVPEKILKYLPVADVYWTNYYMMGRMESSSPLRFVLKQPTLSWAYYITLFSLLVYLVFSFKRRQRIIPIISPPKNASLEFVNTVGMLYFNRGDHRNIARKKIRFFLDHVRRHYFINTDLSDADFPQRLARKSNKDEKEVQELIRAIIHYQKKPVLSKDELMHLNGKIEKFLQDE